MIDHSHSTMYPKFLGESASKIRAMLLGAITKVGKVKDWNRHYERMGSRKKSSYSMVQSLGLLMKVRTILLQKEKERRNFGRMILSFLRIQPRVKNHSDEILPPMENPHHPMIQISLEQYGEMAPFRGCNLLLQYPQSRIFRPIVCWTTMPSIHFIY
jgi:hypothetical protein